MNKAEKTFNLELMALALLAGVAGNVLASWIWDYPNVTGHKAIVAGVALLGVLVTVCIALRRQK